MKKIILSLSILSLLWSCKPTATIATKTEVNEIGVTINLNNVKDDKVMVTITAPAITTDEIVYHIPKIIPGTYSEDDYGKFIDDFKAVDANGTALEVTKADTNSWSIKNAKKLQKITYWVNDTYDVESGGGFGSGIFSPAGTNILEGKNFMLNNHGFVGFFDNKKDLTYNVTILHPDTLFGATSLIDSDNSNLSDTFIVSRYNDLVDNPIMYSAPDYTTFNVDGMDILLSVYSPTGKHTAKALTADLEKCMRAQKKFLGPINTNKRYTVLLYLSDIKAKDAKGFGALEHNSSTSVVFPEMMQSSMLGKQIIDVVSHEFFHIVTPLGVHSNEIHYFDFNSPKMSKHLWMYEGVTEYFANLFQVNQGLIDEEAFYKRMVGKIKNASRMNDKMSFTTMSENVLVAPYKDQYLNVYEKGALIGMCIDIIIREKSNGQKGILDLMQKLTTEFGPKKPFNDNELFDKITQLTYPEVGDFLTTYVSGTTPIPYDVYFAKVGIAKSKISKAVNPFLFKKSAGISGNPTTKEILVKNNADLNPFLTSIGLKGDDVITAVNGTDYNLDNLSEMMVAAQNWRNGDAVTFKIRREGKEQVLSGKVSLSYEESEGYHIVDTTKATIKDAWLKG
ncbi:peptidase M61 [Flavobacterium sp. SUN052]|uniref:M61 family metallopeptidase n=1 Tax=Flavobacterium sp. SUN052 TaxID=3002441 RepID=UPI00237E2D8B|nr:peptidase M61 [Flavobacterium sp. SUN052]MEC4005283.1 peptidase M61 [Flavobacterium sp. SUN052]